jgi:hypothetical protein
MQAIQRLRAKARAAGTLKDSPQQQVLLDSEVISIVPAQASYLYVPYYDPAIVYAPPPAYYSSTNFITYSPPFLVGAWLNFDCDWHHRTVWTGDRRRWVARDNHDWRHPIFPGQPGYVHDPNRHPWSPPANAPRMPTIVNTYRRNEIARPAPFNAAPAPRPTFAQDNRPDRRDDAANRPQRNDSRNREINFARPVPTVAVAATQPATITAATSAPMPATPPAPVRQGNFNRDRNNSAEQPNRAISFQAPPPTTRQAPANIATVTAATLPPSNYPYGAPPAARIVPAFTGPVVQSMPQPVATHSQPMHLASPPPAPAPAAAPPPPAPDKPQSEDRGRGNSDQKKQLN